MTLTSPMEALLVRELPEGSEWRYEPKWDGFRCLAERNGDEVTLTSKSGKPLGRYFPEVVAMLAKLKAKRWILDGELVIDIGGALSFSALQLRLHPAESRIRRLALETPARFVLFDLLLTEKGDSLIGTPLGERRRRLEAWFKKFGNNDFIALSPQTDSLHEARGWLQTHGSSIDGIVAKNANDVYQPGERAMRKYKQAKTADCVVGGFRYGSKSNVVASLLLGLYGADGKLHHVGFTSALKELDKDELTAKLEKLVAPPGFTGNAPGGPSRWSTERSGDWQPLQPKLVIEVQYDHVSDGRFRHGTKFLRWRPDKAPRQCTMEQIDG
ncbi:MAG TPA: ATP-dependent DNA ligase [Pseudomonadales bacterium]